MTILVDPRRGSGELIPYFRPYDIPVQETLLPSADFAFYGELETGMELIGFERKVITDMATSKRDNRLQGFQLPNMSEDYAMSHLIVEGIWQANDTGHIEVRYGKSWRPLRPSMAFRELDHFLAELEYKRGIYVGRTSTRQQTVAYIVSRFKFFNEQVWTQHCRTEKIYAPFSGSDDGGGVRGSRRSGFIKRTVPTLERQMAQVDGIGADAYWIGKRFGNMEELMEYSADEIAETEVERNTKEGRKKAKLGPAKAMKIWRAEREA